MKKYIAAALLLIVLAACNPAISSSGTATQPASSLPSSTVDPLEMVRQQANIKPEDSGRTFSFPVSTRFTIFLDDAAYPVNDLACSPSGVIGQVSNGSLRGPGLYPVQFEAVQVGECTLADRGFSVTIRVGP